jgi:hypothetical protein
VQDRPELGDTCLQRAPASFVFCSHMYQFTFHPFCVASKVLRPVGVSTPMRSEVYIIGDRSEPT